MRLRGRFFSDDRAGDFACRSAISQEHVLFAEDGKPADADMNAATIVLVRAEIADELTRIVEVVTATDPIVIFLSRGWKKRKSKIPKRPMRL